MATRLFTRPVVNRVTGRRQFSGYIGSESAYEQWIYWNTMAGTAIGGFGLAGLTTYEAVEQCVRKECNWIGIPFATAFAFLGGVAIGGATGFVVGVSGPLPYLSLMYYGYTRWSENRKKE